MFTAAILTVTPKLETDQMSTHRRMEKQREINSYSRTFLHSLLTHATGTEHKKVTTKEMKEDRHTQHIKCGSISSKFGTGNNTTCLGVPSSLTKLC